MKRETFKITLPLSSEQIDLSRLPKEHIEAAVRAIGKSETDREEGKSDGSL